MIRLYYEGDLRVGLHIQFPPEEIRYLQTIRHSQGEVEVFNGKGLVARGEWVKKTFLIQEVRKSSMPLYDLEVAVGMPENSLIPDLIRALSELGAKKLILLKAARSQNTKKRVEISERFKKIALEASRQSERGWPLELQTADWGEIFQKNYDQMWFFDEDSAASSKTPSLDSGGKAVLKSALLLIGPEGGWTTEEREAARRASMKFVHFDTPVLTVATAAICASFFAIQQMCPKEIAS